MDFTGIIEYYNKRLNDFKCPVHSEFVEIVGDDNDLGNIKTLACCQEFLDEQMGKIREFSIDFIAEKAVSGLIVKGERIASGFEVKIGVPFADNKLNENYNWVQSIMREYIPGTSKEQFALYIYEQAALKIKSISSVEQIREFDSILTSTVKRFIDKQFIIIITLFNILNLINT